MAVAPGSAKGKGKSPTPVARTAVPGAAQKDASAWVTVVRKGHTKIVTAKPPDFGKPRTAPVPASAEELTALIAASGEPVVAMPTSSAEAELMRSVLDANNKVDCLFVFNYQTQEGFADYLREPWCRPRSRVSPSAFRKRAPLCAKICSPLSRKSPKAQSRRCESHSLSNG